MEGMEEEYGAMSKATFKLLMDKNKRQESGREKRRKKTIEKERTREEGGVKRECV